MKILINRKPIDGPWGGGNLLVSALCAGLKARGHNVTHNLENDIDLIFMQDPRYSDLGISINEIIKYKNHFPNTKIVHRVNECDARKGTLDMDDLLLACSRHTDLTVFVSKWMKNYHLEKGWKCKKSSVIYNGVNKEHFCESKQKIDNSKVNIVTHHWSNNRMKGFDVYEAIDRFVDNHPEFTFSYIGRELGTFKNAKIVSPLHGAELGKELSKYDVYVSGSLFDPGPNHILESIASGIPTYVISKGGGSVEFAGKDHTFDSIEDLIRILQTKKYTKNSLEVRSWEACVESYICAFTSLV